MISTSPVLSDKVHISANSDSDHVGMCMPVCFPVLTVNTYLNFLTGESGLVYKAYLNTAVGTQIVAVKTVKGL